MVAIPTTAHPALRWARPDTDPTPARHRSTPTWSAPPPADRTSRTAG